MGTYHSGLDVVPPDRAKQLARELKMPAAVTIAMDDLAGACQEGLLALCVGAGLKVMHCLIEESVTAVAGPKGKHDPARQATRHGSEDGAVTLGGRRVPVRRPRVRTVDGRAEVPIPAYDLFASRDLLTQMAVARMLASLSTRRYPVGLEPVGTEVESAARGPPGRALRSGSPSGRARRSWRSFEEPAFGGRGRHGAGTARGGGCQRGWRWPSAMAATS